MINSIKVKELKPLHDNILVTEMNFTERFTSGGIVIVGDDGKASGIRPRWGKVYAVGPEQTDVSVGQYVLVAHGRWTRGIKIEDDTGEFMIRRIDNNDILLISDEPQTDDTQSTAIIAQKKTLG
jgi:co-chaperonin GroES (HSP10)